MTRHEPLSASRPASSRWRVTIPGSRISQGEPRCSMELIPRVMPTHGMISGWQPVVCCMRGTSRDHEVHYYGRGRIRMSRV